MLVYSTATRNPIVTLWAKLGLGPAAFTGLTLRNGFSHGAGLTHAFACG